MNDALILFLVSSVDTLVNKVEYLSLLYYQDSEKNALLSLDERRVTVLFLLIMLMGVILYVITFYSYQHTKDFRRQHKQRLQEHEAKNAAMRNLLMSKVGIIRKIQETDVEKECNIRITEAEWNEMCVYLDNIDNMFCSRIRRQFASLNEDDIRLLILLRLQLSAKHLSLIYNISEKSVKQKLFVFKQKVGIEGRKQSLREFVREF